MNRTERMEFAKRYGTVKVDGKKYWLKQQAFVDNYGTDGGVRYYASAIDRRGNQFKIAWDTTASWDAMNKAVNLRERIKQAENNGEDCLVERHELEQITSDWGDVDSYNFDESDACDWDKPVEAVEI